MDPIIQAPAVNPVGIAECPASFVRTPRRYSPGTRAGAALILGTFVVVVLSTGAASLATYCLTSYAGMPFAFP